MVDKFNVVDSGVLKKRLQDKNFVNSAISVSEKRLVISDMDEVLVNTAIKWVSLCYFEKMFTDHNLLKVENILGRLDYYLNKYLNIEEVDLISVYNRDDFYEDLEPTSLGISLADLNNRNIIDLVIISKTMSKHFDAKKRFCKKFFPKAKLILINLNENKSDAINSEPRYNEYTTFIDDHIPVLEDIVLNTNSFCKEIMFPIYGYNKETSELLQKACSIQMIDLKKFEVVL